MPSLAAGTYYVVSKGKSENGKITTHIICKSPETKIGSEDKTIFCLAAFVILTGLLGKIKWTILMKWAASKKRFWLKGSAIENDLASLTEYDASGGWKNNGCRWRLGVRPGRAYMHHQKY